MTLDGFFFYKTTYLLIIKLLKIDVHEYKISYLNVSIKKSPTHPEHLNSLGCFYGKVVQSTHELFWDIRKLLGILKKLLCIQFYNLSY